MTRLVAAVVVALIAAVPCAAADAPEWLRRATADAPTGVEAGALVLFDEAVVTVNEDGKVSTIRRYAVRVTSSDGRRAAALRHVYVNPSGKVKAIRGWIVDGAGGVRDLKDRHVVDVAAVNNDVYNEVRVRAVSGVEEISEGGVFGAEIEAEERWLFAQLEWPLQERWPVRLVRRTLRLPSGWTATSVTFNAHPIQPRAEGGALVWEARDLQAIDEERNMPPVSSLAARLAVSFFGPDGSRRAGQFETWEQVAAWLQGLGDPAAVPTAAVTSKARELTGGVAADFERVQIIARFVQSLQYVSIQTGLGRGGGYQPRAPDVVLAKNYGDCKDKVTLMRAMLGAIGIDSHLVTIFSGDRDYVREEWPSPQQFNHAIIAIAVAGAPPDSSIITDETRGRLLLFDPTDESTPLGELPLHEQGSLALLVAKGGGLRRVPFAPADRHGVVREIDAVLDPRGAIVAQIHETRRGADAAGIRALRRAVAPAVYRRHVERGFIEAMPGARLTRLDPHDDASTDVRIEVEVQIPAHAQVTGNLTIVKPLVGLDTRTMPVPEVKRRHPFVQEPIRRQETVRLRLPPGVIVDELPAPIRVSGAFGSYELSYSQEAGTIMARRRLELPLRTVPLAEQHDLRALLAKVRDADQSPLVLVAR